MTLFIPEHLGKLEIIKMLVKMISAYADKYETEKLTSFDEFYYTYSQDPVKRFIEICNPSIPDGQDKDIVINYIIHHFYTCKGTLEVIELMKKYLGTNFTSIDINANGISVSINEINIADVKNFKESLIDFLNHLLYFEDAKLAAKYINLELKEELNESLGISINKYQLFKFNL